MSGDLQQRVEQAVRHVVDRLVPINVSARHMHITQDHLDYHLTMENYAETKWRFFEQTILETLMKET